MIIKKIVLSISLFTASLISIYSQQKCIFYDADSIPIGIFYKSNGKIDSTTYWDLRRNKYNVDFTGKIKYKFGVDSLNNFIIAQFRQKVDNVEIVDVALVYIFVDEGKIKEIRILKRINNNIKFDTIINNILLNAQKDLEFPVKTDKPLLLPYLFKVR